MPKHRQTGFCVIRSQLEESGFGERFYAGCYVVGMYFSLERAEEVAGQYHQLMIEQGFKPEDFQFEVQTSTYYDE